MANETAQDRTEQATPERLKKAREEGQIPTSEEVPSALVLVFLLVALVVCGPSLLSYFAAEMRQGLECKSNAGDIAGMSSLLKGKTISAMLVMTPVMLAVIVGSVLASILAGGWTFSTTAIKLNWERISPFAGAKNLFSGRSVFHLAVSMAKLVVIGWIVWSYLCDKLASLPALHWCSPEGLLVAIGQLSMGAAGRVAVAMVAIAAADLIYQRWSFKRKMRMTRQEVKEERKQYELPVEVKVRMRAMQIAAVRKRMLRSVPTADVVIANPTHYAVALKYDPARMDAPIVVAKGADFLCQTIKDIAAKHGVPIVERPELARALYSAADEGESVPETLFVAVAEVLAMIYRVRKKRPG